MAPFAPQRFVPWPHDDAQVWQCPPVQNVFAAQAVVALHTGQPFASVPQVSVPWPLHRVAPLAQLVPQVPHAPPEQNVEQEFVCCHEVQPEASATQVSTFRPLQRVVPAVQVVLHAAQEPFAHRLPDWHWLVVHCVQPEMTFQVQVCTPLPATHCDAAMEHAWQLLQAPLVHTSP